MTGEIVIITPELSGAGGVGDYTQRVVEAWPHEQRPKVLLSLGALPAAAKGLLVQYSAYGFDRHGYPRKLICELINWKRKTRGRLVIMFHEIWTFWPTLNRNAVWQYFHRRSIKRLVECADAIFTTTPSQGAHLERLCPGKSVRVLPVGSNIRRNEDVDLARQPGWAVLFGLEAGRVHALKQMRGSLTALAAAGSITKIITVGAGDGSFARQERELLSALQLKEDFEQLGRQDESEISRLLLGASFGISAQNELSLDKSGTLMAYAAHGLNVINECAVRKKPEPVCLLISSDELLRGVPEAEMKDRAECLRGWQERTSSWKLIAAAFAEAFPSN